MAVPARAPDHIFKIDRRQRMHSGGLVVRVYQIVGTELYGWDTNRDDPPVERPRQESIEAAEDDADETLQRHGHTCDDGCYRWRSLT